MADRSGTLNRAIEVYNRYRSPMATAEWVGGSDPNFRIRFSGPFCTTCCPDDYIDDLRYELDALGVHPSRTSIREIERTGLETYLVTIRIEGSEGDRS